MNTDPVDFRPIPTCLVPLPVVEAPAPPSAASAGLPRVLLEAAGRGSHERRLALLGLFLGLLALSEVVILLVLSTPRRLLVYDDAPRRPLIGEGVR